MKFSTRFYLSTVVLVLALVGGVKLAAQESKVALTTDTEVKLSDTELVQLENVSLKRALNQLQEQLAIVQQQLSAYQQKDAQADAPKVNEQITGFLKKVCDARKIPDAQCGGLTTKAGPDGKPVYSITPPVKQEARGK